MDIVGRRINNHGTMHWVFFGFGEINGKPLMLITEEKLMQIVKAEGFSLNVIDKKD